MKTLHIPASLNIQSVDHSTDVLVGMTGKFGDPGQRTLLGLVFANSGRLTFSCVTSVETYLDIIRVPKKIARASHASIDEVGLHALPIDASHCKAIREHMLRSCTKGELSLGAFALNSGTEDDDIADLCLIGDPSDPDFRGSLASLRVGKARLPIIDGVHRTHALLSLVADKSVGAEVKAALVHVSVTFDGRPDRVKQDFVDAHRSKPLPPAVMANFMRS